MENPLEAVEKIELETADASVRQERRWLRTTPLLFALLFFWELQLRLFIYEQPFSFPAIAYILLFSLFHAIGLRLLTGLLGPRLNYALAVLLLTLLTVLFIAQYVYYLFFKTPLLVFSIFNGGQVTEFSGEAMTMVLAHLPQVLSFFLPPIAVLLLTRGCYTCLSWKRLGLLLLAAALVYGGARYSLGFSGNAPASAYNTYFNENNPAQSQEHLGMLTELRLDAQRTLFGFTPKDPPRVTDLAALPKAVNLPAVSKPADTPPVIYRPNALDIDFDTLIGTTPTTELREMHEYFSALTPTRQNEYTGLFSGYNLIMITAEAFSHFLIDETLCPTIYRLATEGFEFTNMYTPIWNVSTSDGEYVAMTGLLPESGVWSFSASAENAMPFSLGHQLAGAGYLQPLAYHNHSYTYYNRNLSHPNMGYDFRAPGHGLAITELWPESDLEMMENSVCDYLYAGREQPFHAYYMTVSGHLQYNFSGNMMAARHQEEVAELPYSEEARAYIACNLELEYALAYLLEQLELAGELENTVIVLSADHYPYGLSAEALNELAGHEVEQNFELYRNGLIIWQAGVEHQVIDEPVSSLDILPTVSNLFGLPFDSRLLMGRDIFAPGSLPLVIFNNRSWITDQASYNAATGELTGDVGQAYVDAVHQLVNARFLYSARILEHDYYRVVLGTE